MEPDYALTLRRKFAAQSGSDQIALLVSLRTLLELLNHRSPVEILELGAGIGTISEMLLEKSSAKITCVENNDFCIGVIKKNLRELRNFTLLTDYSGLDAGHSAEFMIIDVNIGIYSVKKLVSNSRNLNLVFIEGHHLLHRLEISKVLKNTQRRQRLVDVREGKGIKGCAYFEIKKDTSLFAWKTHLDFLSTYTPLRFTQLVLGFRRKVGFHLDRLEKYALIRSARSVWRGRIPWGF